MMKKAVLFSIVFLLAATSLVIFNQNKPDIGNQWQRVDAFTITAGEPIAVIPQHELDVQDDRAVTYRIEFIEDDTLTDTIVVYRNAIYDDISAGFQLEDNRIKVSDYIGPMAFYRSQSFLTNAQFDPTFFDAMEQAVYLIHVPVGTEYSVGS